MPLTVDAAARRIQRFARGLVWTPAHAARFLELHKLEPPPSVTSIEDFVSNSGIISATRPLLTRFMAVCQFDASHAARVDFMMGLSVSGARFLYAWFISTYAPPLVMNCAAGAMLAEMRRASQSLSKLFVAMCERVVAAADSRIMWPRINDEMGQRFVLEMLVFFNKLHFWEKANMNILGRCTEARFWTFLDEMKDHVRSLGNDWLMSDSVFKASVEKDARKMSNGIKDLYSMLNAKAKSFVIRRLERRWDRVAEHAPWASTAKRLFASHMAPGYAARLAADCKAADDVRTAVRHGNVVSARIVLEVLRHEMERRGASASAIEEVVELERRLLPPAAVSRKRRLPPMNNEDFELEDAVEQLAEDEDPACGAPMVMEAEAQAAGFRYALMESVPEKAVTISEMVFWEYCNRDTSASFAPLRVFCNGLSRRELETQRRVAERWEDALKLVDYKVRYGVSFLHLLQHCEDVVMLLLEATSQLLSGAEHALVSDAANAALLELYEAGYSHGDVLENGAFLRFAAFVVARGVQRLELPPRRAATRGEWQRVRADLEQARSGAVKRCVDFLYARFTDMRQDNAHSSLLFSVHLMSQGNSLRVRIQRGFQARLSRGIVGLCRSRAWACDVLANGAELGLLGANASRQQLLSALAAGTTTHTTDFRSAFGHYVHRCAAAGFARVLCARSDAVAQPLPETLYLEARILEVLRVGAQRISQVALVLRGMEVFLRVKRSLRALRKRERREVGAAIDDDPLSARDNALAAPDDDDDNMAEACSCGEHLRRIGLFAQFLENLMDQPYVREITELVDDRTGLLGADPSRVWASEGLDESTERRLAHFAHADVRSGLLHGRCVREGLLRQMDFGGSGLDREEASAFLLSDELLDARHQRFYEGVVREFVQEGLLGVQLPLVPPALNDDDDTALSGGFCGEILFQETELKRRLLGLAKKAHTVFRHNLDMHVSVYSDLFQAAAAKHLSALPAPLDSPLDTPLAPFALPPGTP